jgi:hypothetical protein
MTNMLIGHRAAYVLAIGLALAALPARAAACSLSAGRPFRHPARTHLIVRATPDMVSAARGLPPALARLRAPRELDQWLTRPLELWWWRAKWERLRDRFRPSLPYGQIVHVLRVGGPDSVQLREALTRSGGQAVLVRWGLAANCGTELNPSRAPVFAPGTEFFVTGGLRADSGWPDGRPTLDVMPAGDATHHQRARPEGGPRARPSLTLEAYWRMYEHMPEAGAYQADPARALAQVAAWAQAFPSDSLAIEAHWTLDAARRNARAWEQRAAGRAGRSP